MSPRSFALQALALGSLACAAPAPIQFPPLPSGYTALDGAVFEEGPRAPTYVLDSVAGPKGKELWFGVTPPMDITPLHAARRLDVLPFPSFSDDAVLILVDCSIDGVPDLEVIALAERPRTEEVTRIRRAWRADRRRERIRQIPTRGITCWMAQPRYCAGADLSGTDSAAIAGRCAALFVRKNWFTQARGSHSDQVSLGSDEAGVPLDTVITRRHATLEVEPATSWCSESRCGATFRYLGRDSCTSRLVTMDRDFAGLRFQDQDVGPAPGEVCAPRPPLARIPPTLPDSNGAVIVAEGRATFIFPVNPDINGRWPDFATTASNYEWLAIVAGGDSVWLVTARIYRPTPATPSASFRELVQKSLVDVSRFLDRRFHDEVMEAVVSAEGITGRAVIAVTDSTTVSRLFQTRPALVRLHWCDPYGRCGDDRVAVDYQE